MSASRVALSPPAPERPLAKQAVPSEVFIDQQIRRTRRQVKWVEIFQGILILVVSGLGFLFLTALLDHWVVQGGLPNWARWVLWAGLAGWSVGYFWVKVLPLIVYRIHPLYAAQTIESAQPSLRNNLINFLLLRKDPRGVPEPVLRAVKEATAQQLLDVASESVVDRQPVIRLGYVLVVVVALVAFYLVLSPKNPLVSFGRVLWPWADIPAPTRVQIEAVDPGDITVPRGEAVPVSAQVRGLADKEEVLFYYSTADGQIVEQAIPMKPTDPGLPLYRLPVDSFVARQDTHYFIQAGDARSRTFTIQVEIPLVITAERLVYEYPQYTGLGRSVVQGQGDIQAVEGTKVTIEASANQPLAQAEIDLDGQGRWRVPMRVEGQSARGQLTLRTHPDDPLRPEYTSYLLRAQTVEGEVNRRPTRYMIEVLPDRPPRVDLRLGVLEEVPEEIQLSRSRTVEIRVEAEDSDFGLRRVAIQLQKQGRMLEVPPLLHWPSVPKSPDPKTPSTKLSGRQGPEGHQGVFQAGWQFNPAALGLNPGDVVFYWARAEDTKLPTPNVAETPRRRIVIVEDTTSQPHPSQESSPNQQGQGQTPPAPGQESPTPPDQSQRGEQEKSSPSDQPAGKEPTPPQSAKEPSSGSPQPKEPSSTDSAEQHAGSGKPESAGKSEPTAKTSPGQGEASSGQAGSPKQEAAKEDSQPKGASKPEESQKPQESQKPEENQKPENSQKPEKNGKPEETQKPEAGENSEGQQKSASGPQTEGGQPGTSGSGKPEPQSGQTSSQPTPSGQNGSASPSQSSPASSPQTPQPSSGQPSSGETSATQGAEPSTATGSKTPPQRIDPVSNPGKAFEEILRDRAEQQTTSTQEAGKPSGPSDSSPSQSKPTPQESGVHPDTPPGSRSSEQSGTKPDGVEKSQPETVEHTGEQQQGTSSEQPEGKSPSGASAPGEKTKPSPSAGGSDLPAGQEKPTPAVAKPIPGQPKSSAPEQSAQTKSSPEQGAPEAQEANQPRLGPSGQKPPDSENENQAQSPSISKRQSDSQGDQEGDRSGGGQQGGGQQAPQPGAGTPGSQSPANEGAGTSNQPGPGEQGTRAGEQVQSPQPTGSPGEKRGPGQSTQEPGSEAKSSNMPPSSSKPQPTSEKPEGSEAKRPETKPPKTLPEGPERPGGSSDHPRVPRQGTSPEKPTAHGAGNPQTGGMPSQSSGPPMPNEPLRGDDPNLEYTRQAVDMALEHLRDRLREGDLRILEKLRWSQEDAESFLRRWEELKRQASKASPGSPAQKQLQEVLKNLGLRPQGTSRPGSSAKPDDLRRLRETRTVPPPPDWAEQFRAFRRSVRGEEE